MVWVCPPPPLHTLLPLPAQPAGFRELRKDLPPEWGAVSEPGACSSNLWPRLGAPSWGRGSWARGKGVTARTSRDGHGFPRCAVGRDWGKGSVVGNEAQEKTPRPKQNGAPLGRGAHWQAGDPEASPPKMLGPRGIRRHLEEAGRLAPPVQQAGRPVQGGEEARAAPRGARAGRRGEQLHAARIHLWPERCQGVEPGPPGGRGQVTREPPAGAGGSGRARGGASGNRRSRLQGRKLTLASARPRPAGPTCAPACCSPTAPPC